MKSPPPPVPPGAPKHSIDNEETGLPGIRGWGRVYLIVFGTFVLWVVLLVLLQEFFS